MIMYIDNLQFFTSLNQNIKRNFFISSLCVSTVQYFRLNLILTHAIITNHLVIFLFSFILLYLLILTRHNLVR